MSARIDYGKDLGNAVKHVNVLLADLRLMVSVCMAGALSPEESNGISYSSNLFAGGKRGLVACVSTSGGKSRWTFEFELDYAGDGRVKEESSVLVSRHDGPGKPSMRERCKFSRTALGEVVSRMASA